jgi:hypothetical protein
LGGGRVGGGEGRRRRARRPDCGGNGVTIIGPNWKGMQDGAEPFPVERMSAEDSDRPIPDSTPRPSYSLASRRCAPQVVAVRAAGVGLIPFAGDPL